MKMADQHKAIVLFYRYFIPVECPAVFNENTTFYVEKIQAFQRKVCQKLGCKGRILLSSEGINATLSGLDEQVIKEYISQMKSFHLLHDCGCPAGVQPTDDTVDSRQYFFFEDVDWKESTSNTETIEPFPDLKVSVVKEIVSTGGLVHVQDLPESTGKHLSPKEFHDAISSSDRPVVLVDVRNTFEHDIGHFVLPSGDKAMNPEMVTFSSFDANFCAKHADNLKDKKVLMYCTGGIRCEKASVMLRKRGVQDINQLRGGVHRYCEEFGNDGLFKGLNFVFDQRVAMKPDPCKPQNEIVGVCVNCDTHYDELCGSRVCTVCRDLVLICKTCQKKSREYHCRRHQPWRDCYFTFLEVFDQAELRLQRSQLYELREKNIGSKNQRRTLLRQIEKVSAHLLKLENGEIQVNRDSQRRCRTCMEPITVCDGRCWGFWKKKIEHDTLEEILPVQVGTVVIPGDDWNVLKLGEKVDPLGNLKVGRVVEVKGWTGVVDDKDCVCVLWDDDHSNKGRNQVTRQPQIYRWGVPALDGIRKYDVREVQEVYSLK